MMKLRPSTWRFVVVTTALVLLLGPAAEAGSAPSEPVSREPTAGDLAMIRAQLTHARSALARLAGETVPDPERRELGERVRKAEEALTRYEHIRQRGQGRRRVEGVLYAAGFVLVADDASGVGTLDNVLLPLVAVGVLAARLLTQEPPGMPELGKAWQEVMLAMEAVGTQAENVKKEAARARAIPRREDCQKHLQRCLETPLGKPHSGGSWNYSTCADCADKCREPKFWPDVDHRGQSCRWWEFLGIIPPVNDRPGASHDAH